LRARTPRAPLAVITGLIALVVAGCGASAQPAATDHTNADVTFSTQMIPHHGQLIQIADLVPDRSTDDFAQQLAMHVKSEELADIDLMSGWLRSWNAPVPQSGHEGHDMAGMAGMLASGDIDTLRLARGADFDRKWLSAAARLLRSGIDMARNLQSSGGVHQGTKQLAQRIMANQQQEVDEITKRIS
jgi:uncharacterized protein (DUF305 family)